MSRTRTLVASLAVVGLVSLTSQMWRDEPRVQAVTVDPAVESLLGVPSSVVLSDGSALHLDLAAPVETGPDTVRLDADLFLTTPEAPTGR